MDINLLIKMLEERIHVPRKYMNNNEEGLIGHEVKRYARFLMENENCMGHIPVISKKSYEASDICVRGPGKHKELGILFNLPLPQDYLEFCAKFDGYLFSGGSFVVINNSKEANDYNSLAPRSPELSQNAQLRLFSFASFIGLAGLFAFRWSEKFDKMDIVFVWDYGDVYEPYLLGPDGDRFVSDLDFSSWLQRMIETDSTPLFTCKKWPMADGGWFEDGYPYFKRSK